MKERKTHNSNNHKTSTRLKGYKSSKSISTKDEFLKQYYMSKGEKRFDRDFTLSWGKKHENSPKNITNIPMFLKSKLDNKSYCNSPTSNSQYNPGQSFHFPDLKSERQPKSKLYKEEVYELRQLNEQNVIQALKNKKETELDFNKIAQQYSLKNYRSVQLTPRNKTSLNNSLSHANNTNLFSSNCSTEDNRGFVTECEPTEGISDGKTHSFKPLKSYFAQLNGLKERSYVLKGLEAIYFQDLNKEKALRVEFGKFEKSPYNKDYLNKLRNHVKTHENEHLGLFYNDHALKRLEDPYGDNVTFLKTRKKNLSFQQENTKVSELQAKAEILRNIKSIDDIIISESEKDSKLPQIKNGLGIILSPKSKQIKNGLKKTEYKLQRKEKRPASEIP